MRWLGPDRDEFDLGPDRLTENAFLFEQFYHLQLESPGGKQRPDFGAEAFLGFGKAGEDLLFAHFPQIVLAATLDGE